MENVIDNKNKKIIIIVAAFVVLAIVGTIIGFKLSSSKKVEQKDELKDVLKDLGVSFYEDFYYKNIGNSDEERATKLARFESIGIKIDLDNLSRYNSSEVEDKIDKFVNKKTDEKCDRKNTKVIIYPKSPYGKTDYEIETVLECGFEE